MQQFCDTKKTKLTAFKKPKKMSIRTENNEIKIERD